MWYACFGSRGTADARASSARAGSSHPRSRGAAPTPSPADTTETPAPPRRPHPRGAKPGGGRDIPMQLSYSRARTGSRRSDGDRRRGPEPLAHQRGAAVRQEHLGIVGLGDPAANPAAQYVGEKGLKIPVATFDVGAEAAKRIRTERSPRRSTSSRSCKPTSRSPIWRTRRNTASAPPMRTPARRSSLARTSTPCRCA
jgi:hypothetical protein